MVLNRFSGRVVLAGLATLVIGGAWMPARADQPPKPGYFSFAKTEPTIHEGNINDIHVLISDAQSRGRLSILESYWQPKFTVPLHYHKYHAEIFIILSGHLEWTIGGETHVEGPGDAVYIPPLTEHSVHVFGNEQAHVIFMQLPGGYEIGSAYGASVTPAASKGNPELGKLAGAITDFNPVTPRK